MPVYTSDALILRTYKLGEADRIVVFLTRDRGKKRGVAKGARRAKSPKFIGALEPMTRARVAYVERERRDLVRLNYVEPTRSPLARPRPARRSGTSGYFAELIDEWAPEGHADERLYRLGASVATRSPPACRSSRWRGISSTGCCGCRASIRRRLRMSGLAA